MTKDFKTEQESFWAGEFGNEYVNRNKSNQLLNADTAFFADIFKRTRDVNSFMEFGANIGMNIHAIKRILLDVKISAIEINANACRQLKQIDNLTVYNISILDFEPKEKYDFVFTKGVLIHINPDELEKVYQKMYDTSSKYICVAEYYNPSPVAIPYREYENKLFKRDFAGEMLDKFKDLELIDYKFVYRRDNNFPQDDITWFLMEKI
ncbi:MAG: pseudaminic acid biosynthesis-associated methylase [Phycisphaerales bacterium]